MQRNGVAISRRGQHWVTQQLRRALLDFAHAPEAELSTRASAIMGYDRSDNAVVSPKTACNTSSAMDKAGDQETS